MMFINIIAKKMLIKSIIFVSAFILVLSYNAKVCNNNSIKSYRFNKVPKKLNPGIKASIDSFAKNNIDSCKKSTKCTEIVEKLANTKKIKSILFGVIQENETNEYKDVLNKVKSKDYSIINLSDYLKEKLESILIDNNKFIQKSKYLKSLIKYIDYFVNNKDEFIGIIQNKIRYNYSEKYYFQEKDLPINKQENKIDYLYVLSSLIEKYNELLYKYSTINKNPFLNCKNYIEDDYMYVSLNVGYNIPINNLLIKDDLKYIISNTPLKVFSSIKYYKEIVQSKANNNLKILVKIKSYSKCKTIIFKSDNNTNDVYIKPYSIFELKKLMKHSDENYPIIKLILSCVEEKNDGGINELNIIYSRKEITYGFKNLVKFKNDFFQQ